MARFVFATLMWFIATTVFAWYVRNIANYNVLYGSIGAVIRIIGVDVRACRGSIDRL